MAEIVNLRRVRKAKIRETAAAAAAENRAAFGRSRADKDQVAGEQALAARRLDGHRLYASGDSARPPDPIGHGTD